MQLILDIFSLAALHRIQIESLNGQVFEPSVRVFGDYAENDTLPYDKAKPGLSTSSQVLQRTKTFRTVLVPSIPPTIEGLSFAKFQTKLYQIKSGTRPAFDLSCR